MGNAQAAKPSVISVEDIGAHILNADPALKEVPWSQKQLYARRAIEHAKKQHLEGGTNRVIEPFWDKLKIDKPPSVLPPVAENETSESKPALRTALFQKHINEPKVRQPTRSELGLSSPRSYLSGGGSDDEESSEEEEEEECE